MLYFPNFQTWGVDQLEFWQMVINQFSGREQFFFMCPEKFRGFIHHLVYIVTLGECVVMS